MPKARNILVHFGVWGDGRRAANQAALDCGSERSRWAKVPRQARGEARPETGIDCVPVSAIVVERRVVACLLVMLMTARALSGQRSRSPPCRIRPGPRMCALIDKRVRPPPPVRLARSPDIAHHGLKQNPLRPFVDTSPFLL